MKKETLKSLRASIDALAVEVKKEIEDNGGEVDAVEILRIVKERAGRELLRAHRERLSDDDMRGIVGAVVLGEPEPSGKKWPDQQLLPGMEEFIQCGYLITRESPPSKIHILNSREFHRHLHQEIRKRRIARLLQALDQEQREQAAEDTLFDKADTISEEFGKPPLREALRMALLFKNGQGSKKG